MEIDSTIAEAHTVLGEIAQDHRYDWVNAEDHFRRAIALDGGYATAHQWYSSSLAFRCRFDEAFSEAKRALELDPLSLVINMNLGEVYYDMRQYDKATEQYNSVLSLDHTFGWAHLDLASAYTVRGKFEDAARECEKAITAGVDTASYLSALGWVYSRAGRKNEATLLLDQLVHRARRGESPSYGSIGLLYYDLGEKDKAFEWSDKAYQSHDIWLATIASDPLWDNLRADPKCLALLRKMGLRN